MLFELVILLIAAKIAGHLSAKIGQPTVFGQLVVGVLIGPAVFGWVHHNDLLQELSNLGVILLMFIAGLETNLKDFRSSAKASLFVGTGGIILPFFGGYVCGLIIGLEMFEAMFFGLVLTATSVSISVQTLREIGRLKSKEGSAILGAAVLDDVVVIVLLAFLMSFMGEDVILWMVILKKCIFFSVSLLFAWKLIPWIMQKFAETKLPQASVVLSIILCLSFAYFAEEMGVAAIIGSYLAGLSIGNTKFEQEITEKVEILSFSFFVPIFFISIGIGVELAGVGQFIWLLVPLSLLSIMSKLIGSGLGAKLAGFSWRSSIGIGTGMISRGEVALILAALGKETGIILPEIFTILVLVVLVTTLVSPILLRWSFQGANQETVHQQTQQDVRC